MLFQVILYYKHRIHNFYRLILIFKLYVLIVIQAHVSPEEYRKFERFILKKLCEINKWISCPACNEWFADIPQVKREHHYGY